MDKAAASPEAERRPHVVVSPMRLRMRATGEGGRKAYAEYAAPAPAKRTLSGTSLESEPGPLTKLKKRCVLADARGAQFGRPLVFEPTQQPCSAAIVWLHGFNDKPEWRAEHLAEVRAAHPRWKWIFLRAGRLPITCCKTGSRERYLPSWGDFLDPGTIHVGSQDHESADPGGWYAATATLVAGVLEALERDDGVPPSRVVLVGQSQGAASAAHAALQHPRRLAGLVMLQGWLLPAARAALTEPDRDEGEHRHAGLPVLVAHGTADKEVAYDCATLARRLLQKAGGALEFHSMPGVGHFLDKEEELDLQSKAVLFAERALGKKTRPLQRSGSSSTSLAESTEG